MQLVDELKQEHREILELLNAFKKGRGFEASSWRNDLFRARSLFLSHLAKEDAELYPALAGNATAAGFAEEMKRISGQVTAFLDKYRESHDGPEFSRDYADLMTVLQKRIQSEETVLFPLLT